MEKFKKFQEEEEKNKEEGTQSRDGEYFSNYQQIEKYPLEEIFDKLPSMKDFDHKYSQVSMQMYL